MDSAQSAGESQIVELIDSYLKYRGVDAILGTNRSKLAFETIEKLGMENVFGISEDLLRSDNSTLRCRGAEMLMRIDKKRGLPLVLELLRDSDDGVRSFICGLIHDLGDVRALDDIIAVLERDIDGTVRHHAAFATGAIGTLDTIPLLERIAANETGTDWEGHPIREQILSAIEAIRSRYGRQMSNRTLLVGPKHVGDKVGGCLET